MVEVTKKKEGGGGGASATRNTLPPSSPPTPFRWFVGLIMASVFSLVYFIAPFYMAAALYLCLRYPWHSSTWVFASPILVSAAIPSITLPWKYLKILSPMLEYFHYEEIHENSPVDVKEQLLKGKNYLCVCQPHGALSYCGILSAINMDDDFHDEPGVFPTAVADAVMYTPIVKHVMGIFGLISAKKESMKRALKKPGAKGCVVLYVGGMAELFLSCENEERIYLNKRKGFIKLALQEGVDVLPVYLFGNTSVLSVLKKGILATISRRLQVSLTYIWGRWYLPIPRDCKCLYVMGQPLGLPQIADPTQEDIDKWHAKYCREVKRIFDTYKERVPEYKHKKLEIV